MKVKVSNVAFSKNPYLVGKLLAEFPDAIINEKGTRMSNEELVGYFSDAEAAIVGLEAINAELLDKLPQLKMIAKFGVGLDNIDLEACEQRNITVGWTGGVNRRSVAEMTLGFMLALSRNLFSTSAQLKEGNWNKNGGFQLTGKTIGIVGFGHIARELVLLLKPFQCKILVNDIIDLSSLVSRYEVTSVSKDVLFQEADIITLHTPLTIDTRNLFNKQVFEKMKTSALLINTARGGIVNEVDLKLALQEKKIAGAALDVYEEEPPVDNELLQLENLICTPHTGGNSYEAVVAMGMSALEHLINYKKQMQII
ncbi:phosphoglycerate dehydrogenase [Sediminibacterium sp.]|uniref:phosphoglycerate dehydrogenase n=1 Tax=Sediminibacterium sp. TaxID=1917865 RepID=UPI0025D99466|nr:phosphoglycerate dehydrogenase [Sediminibacterium sp.]MBT9485457.1 phosphoglycerate dehydrogenase [Sediminibacterium sp.]